MSGFIPILGFSTIMECTVALVEPKSEGNVGFVARAMKNFGCTRLAIVKPRCSIGADARGHAMHASDILDSATIISDPAASTLETLHDLAGSCDIVAGTTAKEGNPMKLFRVPVDPRDLAARCRGQRVLLVLGREDTGLTDAELALCDAVVSIPAHPAYPVMNVSHAAAIVLYELWRASTEDTGDGRTFEPATRDRRLAFHAWFKGAVTEGCSGMTESWRLDNFTTAVRNVIERAGITGRELDVIEGFGRTVASKRVAAQGKE